MSHHTPQPIRPGQRISVVGVTGAGKTTLALQLAQCLNIPHIELDALHWEPNWAEAPLEVFRERTIRALSGKAWTVDGNYGKVRDLTWGRADTLIWMDYSFPIIMRRLIKRTLRRIVTQEELWGGNRENWRSAFFSRDSLFLWALKTYRRWHREYPALIARPEYAHLTVIHFRSPCTTQQWLSNIQTPVLQ